MNKDSSNLNLLFSTPVWISLIPNYEEVNNKMYNYIKNLQTKDPEGVKKSNIHGWHSNNFDLDIEEPKFFINAISSSLNEAFNDMSWDVKSHKVKVTSMWSVVNVKNSHNSRHIHSNNYISAAYYVKAPKKAGDIVFHDPRSAAVYHKPKVKEANILNSTIFKVEPKEGLLALFPSYLHHSVETNQSNEERIVISFNINLF